MAETSEKVPIALTGPADVEQCLPPVSTLGKGATTNSLAPHCLGPLDNVETHF